ncbi:hypothetical protein L1049_004707 [Liquidambar formosana]|uniref:Protein kinase domain-containing protein n=1 Tax=Liquidambar formosana TaxID=63359 RepID=A0AAP0WYG3_LIQFO
MFACTLLRYRDDGYDRIWLPYNMPNCVPFDTPLPIDTLGETEFDLPSKVMSTAVKPINGNDSLHLEFDTGDPSLVFYVYMHFAELEKLQGNQFREFKIELNHKPWIGNSVVPIYLNSTTVNSTEPMRGPELRFSIHKTPKATLPPILNAIEVYIVKEFFYKPTHREDVNALMEINSSYARDKNWQGDPCLPLPPWDGLECSYDGYNPPSIMSLNLSSRGLTGKISPSLSKLKSLQYLDLSNNSLTGSLPEALSELPLLKVLNLSGNKLSGSVPPGLVGRQNNGLTLSVEQNPDLCPSAPCKNKKTNFVVPLIVATASLLVILLALVIFWRYKREKKGLEYLHHGCKPPIIHRDVKTSNILLSENLQAKLGDFGFSKFFPVESESHLSTSVVGTPGYLDPEYYFSNRLTEKSDVYSFGVVILELITGRPAIIKGYENTHIVEWVSPILSSGDIRSIVDPRLQGNFDTNSVWKAMETAMACVSPTSIQRPTMNHVLIELKECTEIEMAWDQTGRMEGKVMKSFDSFETNPVGLETKMGPKAR